MKKEKVVVAMSGGVDSSVAAALLKEQGYDVIGVTMDLFSLPVKFCRDENLKSCCGRGAIEDAHRVAVTLRIPHYVVDLKDPFEEKVINDFCQEYVLGRTPNPCIRCNQHVKFVTLLERANNLGANFLATGHYARVVYDLENKHYLLKKGKDKKKDQSYFLYMLNQEQRARILMPVGDLTKDEVRNKALELKLPVAQKPESQEICFVPNNKYVRFLQEKIPEAFHVGPIVDKENRVLSQHQGIPHYTIGQRRGMGIAASHPLYVIDIQAEKNTVVAGSQEGLYKKKLMASDVNMISKFGMKKGMKVRAKIRYKHREAKASVSFLPSDQALVTFEKPQRAITPGQAVVFYTGDIVVGGGIIERGL